MKGKFGRAIFTVAMVAAVGLFLNVASASAIDLTNWNVTGTGNAKVVVTVTPSGTNWVVTFQYNAGSSGLVGLGIDEIGISPSTSFVSLQTGFSDTGSGTEDGFGSFVLTAKDAGGTQGISSPISFTVTGGAPTEFVAHVRFGGGCSGWVSTRTTTPSGDVSNCGTSVPEPSSILLLGSSLLGLGLAGWRRRRQ